MPEFDYGNARLRVMKSRLLSRQTIEDLAEVGNMQEMINALTKTAYREAIEAALVQFSGIEIMTQAWRNDLINTVSKVRRFFSGAAAVLVTWSLASYDVYNIKTVLRGLTQQVPSDEILAGTVPVGELSAADLSTLARSANVQAAIDLLATWRIPLAQPLLVVRTELAGAELFQMELALDRWHFQAIMAATEKDGAALRQLLMRDADANNILTALRLVGAAGLAPFLRQHFNSQDATPLFIGPGRVSLVLLVETANQVSIPRAIASLAKTSYGPVLAANLPHYGATGRLSVFEVALRRQQLKFAANLLIRDPLGIGVLVGYMALKTNEVTNLRRIAHGLQLNEEPELIRAELMFAD